MTQDDTGGSPVATTDEPAAGPAAAPDPAGGVAAAGAAAAASTSSSVDAREDAPDRPWRRAALIGFWTWLGTRLGLGMLSTTAWIGEGRPNLTITAIANKWAVQFDSYWFLGIADRGYRRTPDQADAAFFPLYPALIRAFTPIFGHGWVAALLVSNVALLALLIVLYRLSEQEFGSAPASRTIFYLIAFPTGFFLTAAYNESLFLALIVGAVYCARRERWWAAGAIAAFACTTRSAGIVLLVPLVYEYLRQRRGRIRLDVLGLALLPVGLAAVLVVNRIAMGDAFAFSHAQSLHWGRQWAWPWVPFVDVVQALFRPEPWTMPFSEVWLHNILELSTVLLIIATTVLSVVGPWRVRRDQAMFPLLAATLTLFMVSFPTTFTADIPYPLLSTSRIGLEVFPAFMMLGRLGRHPAVDRTLLVGFLTVQGVLAARFLHGGWIA